MKPTRDRRPFRPRLDRLDDPTVPTVITVTGTGDGVTLDGVTTFREALFAANLNLPVGDAPAGSAAAPDTIKFNIPFQKLHTIRPTSQLPEIIGPVFIDGYSQPGASANTLTDGNNAKPMIELDGSLETDFAVG